LRSFTKLSYLARQGVGRVRRRSAPASINRSPATRSRQRARQEPILFLRFQAPKTLAESDRDSIIRVIDAMVVKHQATWTIKDIKMSMVPCADLVAIAGDASLTTHYSYSSISQYNATRNEQLVLIHR
jgi:hypothetical protein